jgi:hypothetical protein
VRRAVSIAAFGLLLAGLAPATAQVSRIENWPAVKCERYGKAWTQALAKRGRTGLGPEFIARHEAFLASGCPTPGDVCPRSKEELDLANILVVMAMNEGMASTFLPFACRR